MARVTPEEIKRLVGIVDLAKEYGCKLVRSGKNYKCQCLFHDDKTPSLSIMVEENAFICFACDAKGDLVKFVEMYEQISFKEAMAKLAERAGLGGSPPQKAASKLVDKNAGGKREVFQRFSSFKVWPLAKWMPCHEILMARKDIQDEFAKRGIHKAALEHFKIGMVDNGRRICRGYENVKGYAEVIDKPWIGFPYIYGDKVRLVKWRPTFSAGKQFIRPKGMEDCLLVDNPEPDPDGTICVVEGEVDALSLFQIGYRVASLPSGCKSKLSRELIKYLAGFKRIFLCLDNDVEGKAGALRLLQELPEKKTSVVTIPEAQKDANGLLMKCGSNAKFEKEMKALFAKAQLPNAVSYTDLDEAFAQYLQAQQDETPESFFEYPWSNVNEMAVILPGQLVVIASSRSGHGKTTFAVQASLYNAIKKGRTVGYYTAEMDPVRELVPLVTAQLALPEDREHPKQSEVEEAREMCAGADFYFGYDDKADSWEQVKPVLEMGVRRLGIEILVIDHLDFIIREQDSRREIATKGMAMKWLKKDLAAKYGVIVIVLRQTSKGDPKARTRGEEPDAYNVQGGVAGITDANHVFMINRKKVSKPTEGTKDIYEDETTISLGKTRGGGRSSIAKLIFVGKYGRFEKKAVTSDMWEEGRE